MNIPILCENNDYLIINKPAGLTVHGGPHINEPVLTDWLLEKYPELKDVGEDPYRPGIVHRLDKEASGLMIIVKNNPTFEYFKKQFQNRTIKKEYIALAFGQIKKDEGIIDFPIVRSSQGHKMAAIPKSTQKSTEEIIEGPEEKEEHAGRSISNRAKGNLKALEKSREAITEFFIIKKYINFTLLKVKIKTGRTHQIRVHFSAYGYPLLGDNLYGNKKSKVKNSKLNTNRIFLIANKIGFIDNQGEKKEFEIELGPDLKEILTKIK
jgi:23S rRNA pseudouridine1911/1915/1917 synthase